MSCPSVPSLHWHQIFSHYQAGYVCLPSPSIYLCLSVPSQQRGKEDRNILQQKLCQVQKSGESGENVKSWGERGYRTFSGPF